MRLKRFCLIWDKANIMTKSVAPQQKAFLDSLMDGSHELPVALRNLGIRPQEWLKEYRYGYTRFEWPNDGDRDINSGRVFGGWIAAFSDHAVSMTIATTMDDDEWFTTTELTTRMFRPMMQGLITIEGRLVSRGRTSGFVEADWMDDQGRLIARASAAKAIRKFDEIPLGK